MFKIKLVKKCRTENSDAKTNWKLRMPFSAQELPRNTSKGWPWWHDPKFSKFKNSVVTTCHYCSQLISSLRVPLFTLNSWRPRWTSHIPRLPQWCHPKRYHWKGTSRMKNDEKGTLKGTFLQSSPASKTGDKVSWFSHQSLMRKDERAWTNATADVKNPKCIAMSRKLWIPIGIPSPRITKTLENDLWTQRTDSSCSRGANMAWKPPSGNLRNLESTKPCQNCGANMWCKYVVQICANP